MDQFVETGFVVFGLFDLRKKWEKKPAGFISGVAVAKKTLNQSLA
jgi:hypothetical protein